MLILIWNDATFAKTEKIKSIEEPKIFCKVVDLQLALVF